MNRWFNRKAFRRWPVAAVGASAVLHMALGATLSAQSPAEVAGRQAATTSRYPELAAGREAALGGLGLGSLTVGLLLPVDVRVVPASGLDPSGLSALDRRAIDNADNAADELSDWTRSGASALPILLAFTTRQRARRGPVLRGALVYAEAFWLSQGMTLIGKKAFGRARPFAYLPEVERPDNESYDVTLERTFRAMPSGHSSQAWTGAALGITEYLLLVPEAAAWERIAVGFVGGALAGATSALRVRAGQHFPTDVIVGAGIGITSGVAVPLLHRGTLDLPARGSVAEAMLGALGGTVAGVLLGG